MTRAEFDALHRVYSLQDRLERLPSAYVGFHAEPWWVIWAHAAACAGFIGLLVLAILLAGGRFQLGTHL